MSRLGAAVVLAALLAGCAATPPLVPAGAPQAEVNDRLASDDDEDSPNTRVFAVLAIDGVRVRNAIEDQQRIGMGFGTSVLPLLVARTVEAKSASYRIAGRFVTRAPIDAIVRSATGRYQTVEGTVTFAPRPDRVYRLNGRLSPTESSVWIEDFETGEIVSAKVSAPLK